jgi:hypothetical protein
MFLRNHVAGVGAMDLLVVPTIIFRLLFGHPAARTATPDFAQRYRSSDG